MLHFLHFSFYQYLVAFSAFDLYQRARCLMTVRLNCNSSKVSWIYVYFIYSYHFGYCRGNIYPHLCGSCFKTKGKFTDSAKFCSKALKKTCFRHSRRADFQIFSPAGANHGGASLDTKSLSKWSRGPCERLGSARISDIDSVDHRPMWSCVEKASYIWFCLMFWRPRFFLIL